MQRLEEEAKGQLFTSDLTVNEFILVDPGFGPVGLVMGSSHPPRRLSAGGVEQDEEMGVLSQAMYHARELAMSRMEAEADQLKSDGIVGVRLEVKHRMGRPRRVHRRRDCGALK